MYPNNTSVEVPGGAGVVASAKAGGPRYLVWKRKAADRGQRVFYLHGGLHLFVKEQRLRKLRYSNGGLDKHKLLQYAHKVT